MKGECRMKMMSRREFEELYDVNWQAYGKGGFAKIFRGRHRRLNMEIVVKILKGDFSSNTMMREVDVLKRVVHSCLPRVFDVVYMDNMYLSIIEYIPGGTLEQYIARNGPVPYDLLHRWSEELCSALGALHNSVDDNGFPSPIIHADIKPDNIIIRSNNGRPVLIDFNISSTSANSALLGISKRYAPPELLQAYNELCSGLSPSVTPNVRSDLYSLGAVLFFAATGKHYSPSIPDWQALRNRHIPESYIVWLRGLLASRAGDRFSDIGVASAALANTRQVEEGLQHIHNSYRRSLILLWIGAIAGALLCGGGILTIHNSKNGAIAALQQEWEDEIRSADYEDAQNVLFRLEKREPNQLAVPYLKAQTSFEKGAYSEAASLLESQVHGQSTYTKDDGYPDALRLLAQSYERNGQPDQAMTIYEELESKNQLSAYDRRDFAALLVERGDADEAEAQLSIGWNSGRLSDADKDYVNARHYRQAGAKEEARAKMKEVMKNATLEDLMFSAGRYLAMWAIEDGAWDQGVETIDWLMDNTTRESVGKEYYMLLAQASVYQANKTKSATDRTTAFSALSTIIERGWAGADVYNAKAALECDMGNYAEAETTVQNMESRFKSSKMSCARRALIQYAQASQANAPNYSGFVEALAKAKEASGDENDSTYKEALELEARLKKEGRIP